MSHFLIGCVSRHCVQYLDVSTSEALERSLSSATQLGTPPQSELVDYEMETRAKDCTVRLVNYVDGKERQGTMPIIFRQDHGREGNDLESRRFSTLSQPEIYLQDLPSMASDSMKASAEWRTMTISCSKYTSSPTIAQMTAISSSKPGLPIPYCLSAWELCDMCT